ncbi:MAG: hypothetical protein A3E36_03970 [Candidatus Andersenbacteria bacterium RIFCSPHIGHO2_12_FULL_45_11b]|uniref:Uncharacterized protein n=1 Tax=Candidatus Andersenbacteria bacterium RIFCSPHIGHO2_12_FULL_45_11b TaxID=1797282 RepID=A0A1G1X9S0_9BACT|nr:MAG: hypothetical protein A3E36_03970 [Candidatus Andersenbacteria bacterium RIFCSPHIGHO2_12_FULL_45_11b]
MDSTFLATLAAILKSISFIFIYFVIGFGPGFVVGVLLANRFTGKDKPLRIEKHEENIQKAGQHNSQWHPDNPRWKK